jgi:hypothetical protein
VTGTRQARLRPEFAALYPGLDPGAWQDATDLAEQVLNEHLLRPSTGYMLSDRVLTKEHFESAAGSRWPTPYRPHASHRSGDLDPCTRDGP